MTAIKTRNPHRAKALGYLRDGRVTIIRACRDASTGGPPMHVVAEIAPAPGDPTRQSVPVLVSFYGGATSHGGTWRCDEHPGPNECAHRYAVQLVTGHGHLGGRSQ